MMCAIMVVISCPFMVCSRLTASVKRKTNDVVFYESSIPCRLKVVPYADGVTVNITIEVGSRDFRICCGYLSFAVMEKYGVQKCSF